MRKRCFDGYACKNNQCLDYKKKKKNQEGKPPYLKWAVEL